MAQEEEEQKLINEEYKIWKKNSPFLYDLILSSSLEWPSLTVQWLQDKKTVKDDSIDYSVQRLILGTNTGDTESNHLMIAQVRLPTPDSKILESKYEDSCDVYGGFGGAAGKIEVIQKIVHDGEVNRARYMPQNPDIIATKTKFGHINIFDRTKHPSKPDTEDCKANMVLHGHKTDGYGLSWNLHQKGLLLSGANDASICIWDINKQKNTKPIKTYKEHTDVCTDVCWSKRHKNIFGTVSDDKSLMIWDYNTNKPVEIVKSAHRQEVNCLDFSPYNEYLLVTGGSDKYIVLWDTRKLSQKLHSLEGHSDQVFHVKWSPHSEVHLASSGKDRRVMIWDLSQIGMEQSPEDAEDGPPELIFVHGGHTDVVTEFDWNPHDPWVIASIADNNIVQVWQMTDELLNYDDLTQMAALEQ